MATWDKIKIYYDNRLTDTGSSLSATSTESTGDFDVDYIANWLEVNAWQAEDAAMAATQDLTLDLGVGNTATCDYFTLFNHNLNTAGVTVVLQASATGAWAGEEVDAFTPVAPTADTVFHQEFIAPTAVRYWRIHITSATGDAPYIRIASFGELTELDFASAGYDPYQESIKQNVMTTTGGIVAGVHKKYTERPFNIRINDADSALYAKVKTWQDTHEGRQFFLGWETSNNPDDIWLVRSNGRHNNPLQNNSTFRDITLNLTGRKE